MVEQGEPCDLLFDTAGGEALARAAEQAGRIVTIAAEAPGAQYFVVEPDRQQNVRAELSEPDIVTGDAQQIRIVERAKKRGPFSCVLVRERHRD